MLANRPPYRPQQPIRPPLGYGQPIRPADFVWQSVWPYLISIILGGLIILFSVVIFALEIALLGVAGANGATLSGVYASGVGIWSGFFIFIAGILILILKWVKPVRIWALIALCATILATIFSIINLGINASRVQIASAFSYFSYTGTAYATVGGLVAAQLALDIVLFFFCLAFIALYVFITIKASKLTLNKQQQIIYPNQRA